MRSLSILKVVSWLFILKHYQNPYLTFHIFGILIFAFIFYILKSKIVLNWKKLHLSSEEIEINT